MFDVEYSFDTRSCIRKDVRSLMGPYIRIMLLHGMLDKG